MLGGGTLRCLASLLTSSFLATFGPGHLPLVSKNLLSTHKARHRLDSTLPCTACLSLPPGAAPWLPWRILEKQSMFRLFQQIIQYRDKNVDKRRGQLSKNYCLGRTSSRLAAAAHRGLESQGTPITTPTQLRI